jgi:hypothetical protein
MWFLLAELAAVPRAALVVEHRYADVFKLERVRPAAVADWLAEAAVRYPTVPIMFCDTRALAEEWTYRFLGAAVAQHRVERAALPLVRLTATAGPVPAPGADHCRSPRVGAAQRVRRTRQRPLRPEIWDAFRADARRNTRAPRVIGQPVPTGLAYAGVPFGPRNGQAPPGFRGESTYAYAGNPGYGWSG